MGRSGFVPQPDNLGPIVLGFILQPNLPLESTLNHLFLDDYLDKGKVVRRKQSNLTNKVLKFSLYILRTCYAGN